MWRSKSTGFSIEIKVKVPTFKSNLKSTNFPQKYSSKCNSLNVLRYYPSLETGVVQSWKKLQHAKSCRYDFLKIYQSRPPRPVSLGLFKKNYRSSPENGLRSPLIACASVTHDVLFKRELALTKVSLFPIWSSFTGDAGVDGEHYTVSHPISENM